MVSLPVPAWISGLPALAARLSSPGLSVWDPPAAPGVDGEVAPTASPPCEAPDPGGDVVLQTPDRVAAEVEREAAVQRDRVVDRIALCRQAQDAGFRGAQPEADTVRRIAGRQPRDRGQVIGGGGVRGQGRHEVMIAH